MIKFTIIMKPSDGKYRHDEAPMMVNTIISRQDSGLYVILAICHIEYDGKPSSCHYDGKYHHLANMMVDTTISYAGKDHHLATIIVKYHHLATMMVTTIIFEFE